MHFANINKTLFPAVVSILFRFRSILINGSSNPFSSPRALVVRLWPVQVTMQELEGPDPVNRMGAVKKLDFRAVRD